MRTPRALRSTGAGRVIPGHIVDVARERSYERLSLETGSAEPFLPARRLDESFGSLLAAPSPTTSRIRIASS